MGEEKTTNLSSKTMVKGAAIISAAGIVVKIIGAFFRIPLTNWIGELGMSYYQVAYNIYSALLIMATAGFPVALSRMVSEDMALGRNRNAHKVFKVFLVLMTCIGALLALICFFGADMLTAYIGNPLATKAVKAIAPAILLATLLSAYRGYFQGRQNMNPTALTNILEQVVRVIIGLSLTGLFIKKGLDSAAAGAAFGATAGSAAGLALIVFIYILHKNVIHKKLRVGDQVCDDTAKIVKRIFIIAIPIMLGAEVLPLTNSVDMVIVLRRLQATGWTEVEAQSLYAIVSAFCSTLIGLPQIFISSIAISIVPAIARAVTKGNAIDTEENISLGYRLTMFIAAPCAFGMFFLARPILYLMYPMRLEGAETAVHPLMILAISIIFLAVYNTSTGILQAVNKQWKPVIYLLIGVLLKIVIAYITVGIKSINIKGTCAGTIIAFAVAAYLNTLEVEKTTGFKTDYRALIKPIIASVVMGLSAFGIQKLLALAISGRIATVLAVLSGVVIYMIITILFRVITPQDMRMLPKGEKINSLIGRFIKWEA